MIILNTILILLAAVILVPVAVFCVECLLSVLLRRHHTTLETDAQPRVAMLIPAHDEASVIGDTLATLMPTLREGDRVVVIADNCSDETAVIARTIGAEVVERRNTEQRGKAYALEFGLHHLEADPPDIVVVLDADCSVDTDLVRRIADLSFAKDRPVQCRNLSVAEKSAGATHAVSELGFRFKNLVRPLGMSRLGLPCHLMGTGMAIPWDVFRSTALVGDHLAEDMQFGIELALKGYPTLLCPEVGITSRLPDKDDAFLIQRTRWEQGHLRTSLTQAPRLFVAGLAQRRLSLLALALDLTIPPLSLLIVIWAAAFGVTTIAGFFGASWLAALMLAGGGAAISLASIVGWFCFCREAVPLKSLLAIPGYIVRKLPIYVSYFTGRKQKEWVRTEREQPALTGEAVMQARVKLFGVDIDAVRMPQAVSRLMDWIHGDQPARHRYVVTPNVDHTVMLQEHDDFKAAYDDADLIVADGMPVILASRLLRKPLPERVTGADLVPALFEAADEDRPVTAYLLGALPGVAETAAKNVEQKWPSVRVVGTYSPPFGFEHDDEENAAILERIREAKPDVLVVGLGAPKQELWVHKHREQIDAKISFCVGATIDFLAGSTPRAPKWMQRIGLEWLFRVMSEPRRLFKRYARDAWIFPRLVWREWRTGTR